MQVGRSQLSPKERRRRSDQNLCLYCGGSGHFLARCPLKGRAQQPEGEVLVSATKSSLLPRPVLVAQLFVSGNTYPVKVLIDSGYDANIIDAHLAEQLDLRRDPMSNPTPARALDGHLLGTVTHLTCPLRISISGNHHETIQFHFLPSAVHPVILGLHRCHIAMVPGLSPVLPQGGGLTPRHILPSAGF